MQYSQCTEEWKRGSFYLAILAGDCAEEILFDADYKDVYYRIFHNLRNEKKLLDVTTFSWTISKLICSTVDLCDGLT